jgi:predicted CoA-substrate-specific enzyme activase
MRRLKIGMDIGSLTVKGVVVSDQGQVLDKRHVLHNGEIVKVFKEVLFALVDGHDQQEIEVSLTGSHSEVISALLGIEPLEQVAAEVRGARHVFGQCNHIFYLGGSTLMLIDLDDKGNLLDIRTNSVCAAGTGSFLDEQANRMGLDHESANSIEPVASPPSIATRCAVFAKTDIIHRQQEGFSKEELWCGLCQGMSRTAIQTLLKGRTLAGKTVLSGGVASNKGMVHYLKQELGEDLLVSEYSPYLGAIGAALEGQTIPASKALMRLTEVQNFVPSESLSLRSKRPTLVLRKSRYPDFSVHEEFVDSMGNEVRIHIPLDNNFPTKLLLGIDIGSTSTKAVLCDEKGKVVLDVYRRTEGDPVGAGKKLISAIQTVEKRLGKPFEILAVGTTGSGRKIVGAIVGADLIVNEISAHVRGAVSVDPEVTTIFEIGGQDSKYMRVSNGRIVDANMNYVCAAGTGTFVEELGRKLGFSLAEIGEQALGATPPHTSDRCTVFMEQDAGNLSRNGVHKREVMAAILYSVIENYKTKVVGNRPVDKKRIVFQGATARNKGLVAAIENIFDCEVVVSPYCHVMGALGAALLAHEHLLSSGKDKSSFRGLDVANKEIKVTLSNCDLCSNNCVITTAEIDGVSERPSFGYLCGREPEDNKMRKNIEYTPFRTHRYLLGFKAKSKGNGPKIGVPLALSTWGYAPFFRTLLEDLGATPVFSEETDREIVRKGASSTLSDFCFPVKVFFGHVASLIEREDIAAVFVPAMLEEKRNPYTSRRRFCPYLGSGPAYVRGLFEKNPLGPALVNPIIDFNLSENDQIRYLMLGFASVLDFDEERARSALRHAKEVQRAFEEENVRKGMETIEKIKKEGKKGIVIIGRPYNTLDSTVSLHIPMRVSEFGYYVIPMEQLPFRPDLLDRGFYNMYWSYGQKILSAAKQVAKDEDLYGIYLTSFNCGPDSFILNMAEHVMGEKPFLILELDEHGSDGGYVTRIEAFLDVIRQKGKAISTAKEVKPSSLAPQAFKGRTMLIPPMHPITTRLFAAVLRGHGFDALPMPETDEEAFSLGKSVTRGSECTPMALTIGTFIKCLKDMNIPPEKAALFMATATGPCRFGSYAQAQFMALQKAGLGEIPIFSPSSENAYLGIPSQARKEIWDAILTGDYLYKVVLRARPYEREKGIVERKCEEYVRRLEEAFEQRKDPKPVLERAASEILALRKNMPDKPLAGIVGEIYVRCDPFANGFIIKDIEEAGGEAWLAPISEWILYTVWVERAHRNLRGEGFFTRLVNEFSNLFIERKEHEYMEVMRPYLPQRLEPSFEEVVNAGMEYIHHEFEGESILTLGRAVKFFEQGADLVVNVAPFGCMHGHISGSIFERIVSVWKKPVVTSFYDGIVGKTDLKSFILAAKEARQRQETKVFVTNALAD